MSFSLRAFSSFRWEMTVMPIDRVSRHGRFVVILSSSCPLLMILSSNCPLLVILSFSCPLLVILSSNCHVIIIVVNISYQTTLIDFHYENFDSLLLLYVYSGKHVRFGHFEKTSSLHFLLEAYPTFIVKFCLFHKFCSFILYHLVEWD